MFANVWVEIWRFATMNREAKIEGYEWFERVKVWEKTQMVGTKLWY